MTKLRVIPGAMTSAFTVFAVLCLSGTAAFATEPCGDLGECKVLTEINSTDGDIGFHFLMDGDDLIKARVKDSKGFRIFAVDSEKNLRRQTFTEMFVESAEPLCFDPTTDEDPENDEDDFATLEDFVDLWRTGMYTFIGFAAGPERLTGKSELTFDLPAAPQNIAYDDITRVISWTAGDDLGMCATSAELDTLVVQGKLPQHPQNVTVASWEIIFEPDVDDGDPTGALVYSVRVAGDIATKQVTVPADYLASLPADTPIKVEIGAIGEEDNATFTEIDEICVNEDAGC